MGMTNFLYEAKFFSIWFTSNKITHCVKYTITESYSSFITSVLFLWENRFAFNDGYPSKCCEKESRK